jgi:hypothetical protein
VETRPLWQPGQQVPRFEIETTGGIRFRYRDIWQRKHLVLAALAGCATGADAYRGRLEAQAAELTANDTAVAVTLAPLPGLAGPAVVIVDRWGEIQHVAETRGDCTGLPAPPEIIEWLRFIQSQCPECSHR